MTILTVGNNIESNKTAMPLSSHRYGNVFKFAKFILLLYGFKKGTLFVYSMNLTVSVCFKRGYKESDSLYLVNMQHMS